MSNENVGGAISYIKDLPVCLQRFGRFYDGNMVMTCGYREVEYEECIECSIERQLKQLK